MSELDFGPHERDFFVYQHMRTAVRDMQPGDDILHPKVSKVFDAQDQINRCLDRGIDQRRIVVGAALANIDAMNQLTLSMDAPFTEDF